MSNDPARPDLVGNIQFAPAILPTPSGPFAKHLPPETIARIIPAPHLSPPMEKDSLSHALETAFTEHAEIGDLKMRPFSLGTLSLCRRLKLDMITGDRDATDLTDDEKQMQIVAFIFIQSQPMLEVLRAVRDPDFMVTHILPFSMTLPMDALPKAIAELQRVLDQAGAAFTDILPKPDDKAEAAPGN